MGLLPYPATRPPTSTSSAMCPRIGICGDLQDIVHPDSVKAGYECMR